MTKEVKEIRATLCYLICDGKTLMKYRLGNREDMHYGKWVAPGGKFEENETAGECNNREFLEETNLRLKDPTYRGTVIFNNQGRTFKGKQQPNWCVDIFSATEYTGKLKQPEKEKLEWVCNENLLNLPMWEGDKIFTKLVLEDRRLFKITFRYDGENLVDYEVEFVDSKI